MPIRVFVSSDPTVPFGDSWEFVGTLESSEPTINQQAARALQKSPGGSARLSTEFYLSGDPASRWVKAEGEHQAFGIAFDLFGDGSRVLVATKPAQVAPLRSRPPEPHPGLVIRPVMIPVKVSGGVTRMSDLFMPRHAAQHTVEASLEKAPAARPRAGSRRTRWCWRVERYPAATEDGLAAALRRS
jgi:hypothetical protein